MLTDRDGWGCPTCRYVHTDDEPCWFDACTVCDGPYTIGPSTDPVCGTCAQAPDDEPATVAVLSPTDYDEEPW